MHTELVIFDMDGLIFNTEELSFLAWSKAVKDMGFKPDIALFRRSLGGHEPGLEFIYKERFGKYTIEDIFGAAEKYNEEYRAAGAISLKNGFFELLNFLKECGIKTAIGSSSAMHEIKRNFLLTNIDAAEWFDYISSGDMVKNIKPYPDIFLLASKLAGIIPEKCLVLEDSKNGLYAANAAGMPCIVIPDLIPADDDIIKKAAAVLPSLKNVIDFIKNN